MLHHIILDLQHVTTGLRLHQRILNLHLDRKNHRPSTATNCQRSGFDTSRSGTSGLQQSRQPNITRLRLDHRKGSSETATWTNMNNQRMLPATSHERHVRSHERAGIGYARLFVNDRQNQQYSYACFPVEHGLGRT